MKATFHWGSEIKRCRCGLARTHTLQSESLVQGYARDEEGRMDRQSRDTVRLDKCSRGTCGFTSLVLGRGEKEGEKERGLNVEEDLLSMTI